MRSQLIAAALVGLAVLLTDIVLFASVLGVAELTNSILDDADFLARRGALWMLMFALIGGAAFFTLRQRQAVPVRLFWMFVVAVVGFFLESWATYHLLGLAMDLKVVERSNLESGVRLSRAIGVIIKVAVAVGVVTIFSKRRAATVIA